MFRLALRSTYHAGYRADLEGSFPMLVIALIIIDTIMAKHRGACLSW